MFCKHKVCSGIRENKSHFRQIFLEFLSCRNDSGGQAPKIRLILHRSCPHPDGLQIHCIGIEGKLHILQIRNQFLVSDGKSDSGSRHCSRLGKRLYNQKVIISVNQRKRRGRSEIDIGLIHNDDLVTVCGDNAFDLLQRKLDSRGCIGIRKNNPADLLALSCKGRRVRNIVLRIDRKVLPKRNHGIRNPVEIRPYIVKGICDVREQELLSCCKEREKRHGQHIVRSDSHKNLLRLYLITLCKCPDKRRSIHIRIKPHRRIILRKLSGGVRNSRCRRIRALIRIQLDNIRILRLLSRHIGRYTPYILFPAHYCSTFERKS